MPVNNGNGVWTGMRRKKGRFIRFILFIFLVLAVASTALAIEHLLPGHITLLEGDSSLYRMELPSFIKASYPDKDSVSSGITQPVAIYSNNGNTDIDPLGAGKSEIVLKFLGLIPIKKVRINVLPNDTLIAGGEAIGISIKSGGLLVADVSSFKNIDVNSVSPARKAGIKKGDIILKCNGKELTSSSELSEIIGKSGGKTVKLLCVREGVSFYVDVRPEKYGADSSYKIGLWVKDSADGIGTLTFIDPETGMYGALGHGISDGDCGVIFPVRTGETVRAKILSVEKGSSGKPGELRGIFDELRRPLGDVRINNSTGVYGKVRDLNVLGKSSGREYKIGLNYQIVEGPATILSTIDGSGVKEYSIMIEKIYRNRINSPKSMVIKVTDPELIEKTGGIVQGMSGSPIIQNGKIIGAVTHVLINDPTTGYGIFIESMLSNIGKAAKKDAA